MRCSCPYTKKEVITVAELKFELDDKVTRKKADTITLVFKGIHEIEYGEFKITAKFEGRIPSFWKAYLGDGTFTVFYVTISRSSVQSKLEA